MAVVVVCDGCGTQYRRPPSRVGRSNREYCSQACQLATERSSRHLEARFWGKVVKGDNPADCWIWAGSLSSSGYGVLRAGRTGDVHSYWAHRMSYEMAHGSIPEGMLVCHTCDNRRCVNPDHLFLGTPLDNMLDKCRKGRQRSPRGEEKSQAILTEDQVRHIRALHATRKYRQSDIAVQFGLDPAHVGKIVRRVLWKHVT